jgi:hypothetical protein
MVAQVEKGGIKHIVLDNTTGSGDERSRNMESQYVCMHTFPSYSFFRRTSGAMYAGVPTVDFGCE